MREITFKAETDLELFINKMTPFGLNRPNGVIK